jgi:nephrocystin-3
MQNRAIRVFISSTFHDMQAERDELVKRVFPRLRKLCEARGVTWGEVDLRWGITEEQREEALSICLAEIHRCRPFFLGILGERYGWVPEKIPSDILEENAWLGGFERRSITELEILHGVLNNPAMAEHAFFYFRDPAYIDTLPEGQRAPCLEMPTESEIEQYGHNAAEERAEERRRKLLALKERIRASGLPVREAYATPQALGDLVLGDMQQVIDALFPAGPRLDPLDQEAADHETFAATRRKVYISDGRSFERLDRHAQGADPPIVVVGEAGVGKSALLANWAHSYRGRYPDEILLLHCIGATPQSADWRAIIHRLTAEFSRRFGLGLTLPVEPAALRVAFASCLHAVARRGRAILVIDGLDQLEAPDSIAALAWLPEAIPTQIRLILSTQPGEHVEEAGRRGWRTLRLEPLEMCERRRLIGDYLGQYSKALSPGRVERIAAAPLAGNPLFLRTVLEELRLFGVHEQLDERITAYRAAGTLPALYEMILERYEADYERDRQGLVREALSLIWAARKGLAEGELLDLLGAGAGPLPHAFWSPLFLAMEASFIHGAGVVQFSHPYLRQAVEARYLPGPDEKKACHLRLGEYFAGRGLNPRVVEELPWQWAEAGAWDRLYALLSDLDFVGEAWRRDSFEVQSYWAMVEGHTAFRLPEAYRPLLARPDQHTRVLSTIAQLLQNMGYLEQALTLQEFLIQRYRQAQDWRALAPMLSNAAISHVGRGDLQKALDLFCEEAGICQGQGDERGRARALFNQANVFRSLGELGAAYAIYEQVEAYWRGVGDQQSIAASLGNRGHILREWGEIERALGLFEQKERLSRQDGDRLETARALSGQATILLTQGLFEQAKSILQSEERMLRSLGGRADLATCLGNQAIVCYEQGDLAGAMQLYRQQEDICREVGDVRGLAESLGRQGSVHLAWEDLERAMACFQEQESICRDLGLKDELQVSLGNQALVLKARGDLKGAMVLQEEKADLCRQLGNRKGLAIALGNRANILALQGDLEGAMALHKEKEVIDRDLGNISGLAHTLGNQAGILMQKGEAEPALALLRQQERHLRQMQNPEKLARCLVMQADILTRQAGQPLAALPLAEEAYQLAMQAGAQDLASQIRQILGALRGMQSRSGRRE